MTVAVLHSYTHVLGWAYFRVKGGPIFGRRVLENTPIPLFEQILNSSPMGVLSRDYGNCRRGYHTFLPGKSYGSQIRPFSHFTGSFSRPSSADRRFAGTLHGNCAPMLTECMAYFNLINARDFLLGILDGILGTSGKLLTCLLSAQMTLWNTFHPVLLMAIEWR